MTHNWEFKFHRILFSYLSPQRNITFKKFADIFPEMFQTMNKKEKNKNSDFGFQQFLILP